MPATPENNNSISGGDDAPEPKQSLREIAEAAYDDISSQSDDDIGVEGAEPSPGDRGDGRDVHGRFVAKEPSQDAGEAKAKPSSPETPPVETTQKTPDPAAQPGASNQLPEHWSAEDKAMFAKLPQDAQSFLMRRHTEMEADYTRKSQANAEAVQALHSLTPVFQDPDIAKSMQENNFTPMQAIMDWARLHKGAVSANPRDRATTLYEIAERMGFDPARVFAPSRPPVQLTEEQKRDPAIMYFADLHSKAVSDLQALRAELTQFKSSEEGRIQEEALRVTRGSIDAFADEKDAQGKPLRPHFDKVIGLIIESLTADPSRDIQSVYEQACWAHPDVRREMLQAEQNRIHQQQSNERARLAAKGNTRGLTSPVSKPTPNEKAQKGLRGALEASAEEVGF